MSKTKQEIYESTKQMVEEQDKANYLEYYKVFRETQDRRDLTQEEIDSIREKAYKEYKTKEAELYDILDLAYMDYMHDANPITV